MSKMQKNDKISFFCTGCGLCKAFFPQEVEEKNSAFVSYRPISKDSLTFCEKVCLSLDSSPSYSSDSVFGKYKDVYFTHSEDSQIRALGSSGGTLTALALFLLKSKKVDGILQVKQVEPFKLSLSLSTTEEQVKACCGSKYIDSSNLLNILDLVEPGKRYCFIGKPCDVSTLKRLSRINTTIERAIIYYLSFFCAGSPSLSSNRKLVESMGCNPDACKRISYRGNGWPGKTTVIDSNNDVFEASYEYSWMNYLGRDTRNICRFCIDGVGEMADISCGDGWYLEDGKPVFKERRGRNITLIRTEAGEQLFKSISDCGLIVFEKVPNPYDYLRMSNPYQFTRRASMKYMILSMKVAGKATPNYNRKVINRNSKSLSLKSRVRRFFGTLKRIFKGKI